MSHCLNPQKIINPRFNENTDKGKHELHVYRKTFGRQWPPDYRLEIPCGYCSGCLRDKATSWRVRLLHEQMFGNHISTICLTLTINDEYYEQFTQGRKAAAPLFRAFLDRLRYYNNRKIPKHWFCSELGEEGGRLHFHGFLWDYFGSWQDVSRSWRYGFVGIRTFRSAKQLSYAASYITKSGRWHRSYVFSSPALGSGYLNSRFAASAFSENNGVCANFTCSFGDYSFSMPQYYRSKMFSRAYLDGIKVALSESDRPFEKFLSGKKFTDEKRYLEARANLFERSLKLGRSKERPKRVDPLKVYNPYDFDVFNEFDDNLTPF